MDELKQVAITNISKLIEDYVAENGTTKDAVARSIGCSRTALYQKLSGNSNFTLFEGYQLSKLLGCQMVDFFTETHAVV